jgi:hypothetical protein
MTGPTAVAGGCPPSGRCPARRSRFILASNNRPISAAGPNGRTRAASEYIVATGTWPEEDDVSVYKVIEVIGTSSTSWEEAAAEAVQTSAKTIRDLRVAEVVKQDIHLDEGGAITYRTKLQLSFKYEDEH